MRLLQHTELFITQKNYNAQHGVRKAQWGLHYLVVSD